MVPPGPTATEGSLEPYLSLLAGMSFTDQLTFPSRDTTTALWG